MAPRLLLGTAPRLSFKQWGIYHAHRQSGRRLNTSSISSTSMVLNSAQVHRTEFGPSPMRSSRDWRWHFWPECKLPLDSPGKAWLWQRGGIWGNLHSPSLAICSTTLLQHSLPVFPPSSLSRWDIALRCLTFYILTPLRTKFPVQKFLHNQHKIFRNLLIFSNIFWVFAKHLIWKVKTDTSERAFIVCGNRRSPVTARFLMECFM